MTPFATCSCGAGYDRDQCERLAACLTCGEPFFDSSAAAPLDVASVRREAAMAVAQENGAIALELLQRVPEVLATLDELAAAITALMGECRCKNTRIIGSRPSPREVCPHLRGARALARAGRPITQRSTT